MFRNHLIYRAVLYNSLVIAGVIWGLVNGYIQMIFRAETTGIGYGMVAIFILVMIGYAQRVWKTSKMMNDVKDRVLWHGNALKAKRDAAKFPAKCAFVSSAAVWLVTLGLIGNIVGFALAVSGLDLSGGPDAALTAIGQMVAGMKVAFFTTLIGTALGLWTAVNAHILKTANTLLLKDLENL